jgi:hypothetical protein
MIYLVYIPQDIQVVYNTKGKGSHDIPCLPEDIQVQTCSKTRLCFIGQLEKTFFTPSCV